MWMPQGTVVKDFAPYPLQVFGNIVALDVLDSLRLHMRWVTHVVQAPWCTGCYVSGARVVRMNPSCTHFLLHSILQRQPQILQ